MSADSIAPAALSEDSIVPQIMEILRGHDLFPDGLEASVFESQTISRHADLHNEVSLYLCREDSAGPMSHAVLNTREGNEIVTLEECTAINAELEELMLSEGRVG